MEIRDLIIIGSGPSGLTAAIYAARANLKPLLIEGFEAGGALMNTTEVENFPSHPEGIMGPDLMSSMRTQALKFGTEIISDDVSSVDFSLSPKVVRVGKDEFLAKAVIVSTGSKWRHLGIPGETELLGRGVSSCATCDGFFFKGREVVVVGGGDSAMEEALFLSRFASKVTIIHRRDSFKASAIMSLRALENEKINVRFNTEVTEVLGSNKVEGLRIFSKESQGFEVLPTAAVFVAVGHDPSSALFKDQLDIDEGGYIKVASPSAKTSIEGVFACGDVVDHSYRQAITAAGTGCVAALDAERYLMGLS